MRQTPYQHRDTNEDKNAALRQAFMMVGKTTRLRRKIDFGRVRSTGMKWT